ncbi:MAG: ThiF family adenylyltransferase, partial [Bacilli bacterium]|nr:ThiF family adenylyltransferase [Bacilli bacterium]
MLNEFSRLELLIGKDGISKIQGTRIAVFGLGGVGGSAVDALARSGVSSLTIVDNDIVSITNINRQLIANHKSIGKKKTDVMEEHLLSINPNIKVA